MKQINFTFEGVDYTLEYTKGSVKKMAENGFVFSKIEENPTMIQDLFAGAFISKHRMVKSDVINKIYSHMPQKEELLKALTEMYFEPINALYEEPEDAGKNINWEKNFKSTIDTNEV